MPILCADDVHLSRQGRPVLAGITLTLKAGRCVGLIGPNGAGKSTALAALAGLLPPTSGEIRLDGTPLSQLDPWERGRRLAYVPQRPDAGWPMPVRDVVALGRLPWRGVWGRPQPHDKHAIACALQQTDCVHLAERPVTSLSGGEVARVMLAVALAGEPLVLLADEPVAALDPGHQLAIMALFQAKARAGAAILVALHDLTLAARFCDELILLQGGQVVASGPPGAVLTDARLTAVYGIHALRGMAGGEAFVLPWAVTSG